MRGYVGFLGLPPLAPFNLTASVLASDLTSPPFLPRATAAGFLRGTADLDGSADMLSDVLVAGVAQALIFRDALAELVSGVAISLLAGPLGLVQQELQALDVSGVTGAELVGRERFKECHGLNISKRFGSVN